MSETIFVETEIGDIWQVVACPGGSSSQFVGRKAEMVSRLAARIKELESELESERAAHITAAAQGEGRTA